MKLVMIRDGERPALWASACARRKSARPPLAAQRSASPSGPLHLDIGNETAAGQSEALAKPGLARPGGGGAPAGASGAAQGFVKDIFLHVD